MISPNCILDNIKSNAEKDNLRVPKLKDLYNFLYTLNKKIVGKSSMTLGDLASFCVDHNQVPGDSPHEPFVLDYQIFDTDVAERLVDYEGEDDQFRVVITTRYL